MYNSQTNRRVEKQETIQNKKREREIKMSQKKQMESTY